MIKTSHFGQTVNHLAAESGIAKFFLENNLPVISLFIVALMVFMFIFIRGLLKH